MENDPCTLAHPEIAAGAPDRGAVFGVAATGRRSVTARAEREELLTVADPSHAGARSRRRQGNIATVR